MDARIRQAVMERDGYLCTLRRLDPEHVCTNRYGETVEGDLTLEHVKDQPRMGKRAPSDMAHLVVLCYGANVRVPSKRDREMLREYLRRASSRADEPNV